MSGTDSNFSKLIMIITYKNSIRCGINAIWYIVINSNVIQLNRFILLVHSDSYFILSYNDGDGLGTVMMTYDKSNL